MSCQTQKIPYHVTGLTIIMFALLLFGCNPEAKLPVYTIETEGQETTLADQTITTAGGTITGADGFELIIPPDAFAADIRFTVISQDIKSTDLPSGVTVGTPLYNIDDEGELSEKFMKVRLPMDIADDEVPLVITWDPDTGLIDVLGYAGYDENGVEAITRHFSPIAAVKLSLASLGTANITNIAFKPGRDDWQFNNFAAPLTKGGQCQGMTSAALWYWTLKARRATGIDFQDPYPDLPTNEFLWEQYESFDVAGIKTPKFTLDDNMPRKLVAALQGKTNLNKTLEYLSYFTSGDLYNMEKEGSKLFYQISAALKVTKAPQYITLADSTDSENANLHSILCYEKKGDTLSCADPNDAGKAKKLKFDFSEKKWVAYDSKLKWIYSIDKASDNTWSRIPGLWNEMKNGTVGSSEFPGIGYFISEMNSSSVVTTSYEADLVSVNDVGSSKLSFFFSGPGDMDLVHTVYRLDGTTVTELTPDSTLGRVIVDLKEKDLTLIGILIREELKDQEEKFWPWVDFKWLSVEYEKETGDGSCCFYECGDGRTNRGSGYPTGSTLTCSEEAAEQCWAIAGTSPLYTGIVNCSDCTSTACFNKWDDMH